MKSLKRINVALAMAFLFSVLLGIPALADGAAKQEVVDYLTHCTENSHAMKRVPRRRAVYEAWLIGVKSFYNGLTLYLR
jgi:hypothetical protein